MANETFVKSENIRVFPCGGRNVTKDANARLTTEYNLVSIINRLVDQGSFVITPTYSYSANNTNEFVFNIGGYLFTLNASGLNELFSVLPATLFTSGKAVKKFCLIAYIDPGANRTYANDPFQELTCLGSTPTGAYSEGILDVQAIEDEQPVVRFEGIGFTWCELDSRTDISLNDLIEIRYDYTHTNSNYKWASQTPNGVPATVAYKLPSGVTETTGYVPFYVPNTDTQLVLLQAEVDSVPQIPADSKIRFETSRDGYNRSCRIDDGVL